MRRGDVRQFLYLGIDALTDVTYGSGRLSEFNSDRDQTYPMAWIESLSRSAEVLPNGLPYDDYNVKIYIAKQDTQDSLEHQYEALVDDCDEFAQKLIKYYNDVIDSTITYKTITLTSITSEPWIKKNADCLTGVILSFVLRSPDTTNLC